MKQTGNKGNKRCANSEWGKGKWADNYKKPGQQVNHLDVAVGLLGRLQSLMQENHLPILFGWTIFLHYQLVAAKHSKVEIYSILIITSFPLSTKHPTFHKVNYMCVQHAQ